MTNESIEKFIDTKAQKNPKINIHFKQRATVKGLFIRTNDFNELKSKNFWRIVTGSNMESFAKTNDLSLARIFSGLEMVKLT